MSACERPPVGGVDEPLPEGAALLDLPRLLQDRPAIGGKWYEYSVDGHVLVPKDEAWVVRSPRSGDVGLSIESIYDDETGDSGVFHLRLAPREGADWGSSSTWVSPRNVKSVAAVCVRLDAAIANAAGDDGIDDGTRDCTGTDWDLRLVLQSRLSVFAGFAVAEPAIFVADDVRLARFDGVEPTALPAPETIAELTDSADATSSDWNFQAFAPDLPEAGQVFGPLSRVVDTETPWWLYAHGTLAGFTVTAVDDFILFEGQATDVDLSTFTVDVDGARAWSHTVFPAEGTTFFSITSEGAHVVDASTIAAPYAPGDAGALLPGNTRAWDLAVVVDDAGGEPHVLLSAAAAAGLESGVGQPLVNDDTERTTEP